MQLPKETHPIDVARETGDCGTQLYCGVGVVEGGGEKELSLFA